MLFHKTRSASTSWAPASQGRSHDATFYASCPSFLLLLHFTHFLICLSCLGALRSEGTPERVFLHFFRKGFRTGACTDIQHPCAQKCFLLQCQRNMFKSSCRVRGMGPPQGSAFACAASTINKTKKLRPKKIASFVEDCYHNRTIWRTL